MADYSYNTPFVYPSGPFTHIPHNSPPQYVPSAYSSPYKDSSQQQPSSVEYHFHYHYPPEAFLHAYFASMPRKTVHWEDEVPRTPSPAMSTSSVASSAGPITPENYHHPLPSVPVQYPPHQYGAYLTAHGPYVQSPYAQSPYAQKSLITNINPVLSVATFVDPRTRPFIWALYDHPNELHSRPDNSPSSMRSPSRYPIPPSTLGLPATSPPVPHLKISCALLPFTIVVNSSHLYGQDYVTVGDVFAEIYKQLRIQITPDEYARISAGNKEVRTGVDKAFYARVAAAREGSEQARQQGLRRSDLLMESQMFSGLDMRSDGTAVLHVHPLPPY